jgi:ubiquinone/menaquinone biosynthesis C-methylase UbiE
MPAERYTPGHSDNATAFMARRTAESHAQFFLPYLRPGMCLLDCGCGPGTITLGLAERVAPGFVVGIDLSAEQCEIATRNAREAGVENVQFQPSLVYSLPFPDAHFDAVFAHALFEHLAEPVRATQEIFRVLKPGGVVGLRAPDWGGFLLEPDTPEVQAALDCYASLQTRNGGTPHAGRKLSGWLRSAGFVEITPSMNGQCYVDATQPAEYLALRLDATAITGELPAVEATQHAAALRTWGSIPHALFLQIWCEAIAFRPPAP